MDAGGQVCAMGTGGRLSDAQRQRAKEVPAGCLRGGVLVVAPSRCCCREQDVLGWRLWSAMWLVIDARIRNAPPNQMHPLLGSRVAPEPHTTATGAQGVAVARCWLAGNEQLGRAGRGCEWDGSHYRVVGTCNLHEHTHHGANMRAKVCGGYSVSLCTVSSKAIRRSSAKQAKASVLRRKCWRGANSIIDIASITERGPRVGVQYTRKTLFAWPSHVGRVRHVGMDLDGGVERLRRPVMLQVVVVWCFVL